MTDGALVVEEALEEGIFDASSIEDSVVTPGLRLGSNEADLSLPYLGPYSTWKIPKSPTTLSGQESTEKLLCVFLGVAAGARKAGQLLDKNILLGQCCGYCGGVPKISSTAELACIFWCFHGL